MPPPSSNRKGPGLMCHVTYGDALSPNARRETWSMLLGGRQLVDRTSFFIPSQQISVEQAWRVSATSIARIAFSTMHDLRCACLPPWLVMCSLSPWPEILPYLYVLINVKQVQSTSYSTPNFMPETVYKGKLQSIHQLVSSSRQLRVADATIFVVLDSTELSQEHMLARACFLALPSFYNTLFPSVSATFFSCLFAFPSPFSSHRSRTAGG